MICSMKKFGELDEEGVFQLLKNKFVFLVPF